MKAATRRGSARFLIIFCLLGAGIFGLQPAARATVFNNIKCWNFASVFFPGGALGSCTGQDIDGKVGYPLFVNSPRANCEPGNWQLSDKQIVSGSFPPGISFKSGGASHIEGIPEKRGHWIVKLKVDHLYCNGESYYGFEQELRFHITGSGSVNY